MIRKRHLPTIFALLLFLASSAGALVAYARMLERDRPETVALGGLRRGVETFLLLSNNRCVGYFESNVYDEGEKLVMELNGDLQARYKDHLLPANLTSKAFFNSLGQLGGSFFKLKHESNEVILGTVNVNPIRVSVTLLSEGEETRHEMSLPGPVLLSENPDATFGIEYSYLSSLPTAQVAGLGTPILSSLQLRLVRPEDASASCRRDSLQALDLEPLVSSLEKYQGTFEQLRQIGGF